MQDWEGIGSFNEEFAESNHTTGNSENCTSGSLRGVQAREIAISKRQYIQRNAKVMAIKKEVSPRKRRNTGTVEDRERIKRRRLEVYDSCRYELVHMGGSF